MKLFVIAVATAAVVGTTAYAQNSRVLEPEARPGQPTAGPTQTVDPRTTTPGKLPWPSPALDRPTEQKVAPPGIRTLIACHQELRAARAGLQGEGPRQKRARSVWRSSYRLCHARASAEGPGGLSPPPVGPGPPFLANACDLAPLRWGLFVWTFDGHSPGILPPGPCAASSCRVAVGRPPE